MSTKVSIKYRDYTTTKPGFHLYEDVLDSFDEDEGKPEPLANLRL